MKKILFIFVVLFMSLFVVSCKATKKGELKKFFNSHTFDVSMKIKDNYEEIELLQMIVTKKAISIETASILLPMGKISLIIDNQNNLYFYLEDEIMHTKLEEEGKQNNENDVYNYISNIIESEYQLTFVFDMGKYIEDVGTDIDEYMDDFDENIKDILSNKSKISFVCIFNEEGKVSKIKYVDTNFEIILYVNSYTNNKKKDAEDIGIEEIQIPKIEDCRSFPNEEFENYLNTGIGSSELYLDLNEITYGFKVDNYIYLCDEEYLYKYDANGNVIYGTLDLRCQGIAYYVKDKYLYVAAHYPYSSRYEDSDSYDGTVTQINLANFKIEKQVHVKCLPESIVVDNRGNVYLSRGANQHVNNVQVNMETGELTPIFKGYQMDVLLYDSINDAIIRFIPGGRSLTYKYDGSSWVEAGSSSIRAKKVYYKEDNSYITSSGIYEFDLLKNTYVLNEFNLKNFINCYTQYVVAYNEKAYILSSDSPIKKQIDTLIIYDLKTDIAKEIQIPEKYHSKVVFAYVNLDYLYIVNTEGKVLKIKL